MISSVSTTPRFSAQYAGSEDKRSLAQSALKQALKVRRKWGYHLHQPVSAFEITRRTGIGIWFQNYPSMEGMYCHYTDQAPVIILGAERPAGRQHFNCAHELGHHEFNHGTRVDELIEGTVGRGQGRDRLAFDPVEYLADRFASYLLMPKAAVDRALGLRGLDPATCDPIDLYVVAGVLGVGFQTLVFHMCYSLGLITCDRSKQLERVKLPALRANLLGEPCRNLVVLDNHWEAESLDIQIGDTLLVPVDWGWDETHFALKTKTTLWEERAALMPQRQGEFLLPRPSEAALKVRVSRQGYVGRYEYRYWPDPDEEDEVTNEH